MINAVIFDFDGVIIDSEPLHYKAFKTILNGFQQDLDYSSYLAHYAGLATRKLLPKLLADYKIQIPEQELQNLLQQKEQLYRKFLTTEEIRTTPGLKTLLNSAAEHVHSMAICSSSSLAEVNTALEKLEDGTLKPFFKHIITAEQITHPKPAPDGYLKALACLAASPEESLAIEDTALGIQAAKAAGIYVVGLAITQPAEKLAAANQVVKNLADIRLETI